MIPAEIVSEFLKKIEERSVPGNDESGFRMARLAGNLEGEFFNIAIHLKYDCPEGYLSFVNYLKKTQA